MQLQLYVVSTPIGTISDISQRALETLKEVEYIFCEDTRVTRNLLNFYEIRGKNLIPLHAHNEEEKVEDSIAMLLEKEANAAYVSDAGTPGVSDPGGRLVNEARRNGIKILTVPGPSALSSAIAVSAFPCKRTLFCGFLPKQKKAIMEELELWKKIAPVNCVFFESPHRILSTVKTFAEALDNGEKIAVLREISKKYEDHIIGTLPEVQNQLENHSGKIGEVTVCLFLPKEVAESASALDSHEKVISLCQEVGISLEENYDIKKTLTQVIIKKIEHSKEQGQKISTKSLIKELSQEFNLPNRDLYQSVMEWKKRNESN